MRYKFRGKNVENGRWVYGDLLQRDDRTHITELEDTYGYYQMVYVNSETIGQYTGLKDCNGVEIYEGDILSKEQAMREVYFDEGGFYSEAYPLALSVEAGFAVIGNIYDNPELMKGGEE